MLIDESKMAVDSSFSFLSLRKQHTNLKLKLLFKIETQTTLTEQNRSAKTSYDRPDSNRQKPNHDQPSSARTLHTIAIDQIQIAHYTTTQANYRCINSAKLPMKLISKNHPLVEY